MPNLNNQVSPSAIAFIDTKVEDYQSLIAGVKPGTEVVVLDGNKDAIDQITQVLSARSNIDSIHIVSHGAPGSLQLGNGSLSADNLEVYSEKLQQWRSALTPCADILIYGCNVASAPRACPKVRQGMNSPAQSSSRLKPTAYPKVRQGMNSPAQSSSRLKPTENKPAIESLSEDFRYETGNSFPGGSDEYAIDNERAIDNEQAIDLDGFSFIQRIAQLTNTNVAASQNLTGSVAKGGDWELEVRTGKIETPLVFEAEVLAGYEYVLNSFGAATNFPITSSLRKVASGDFNKDGNLDLAFATTGEGRNVSIALGDGTGKFGAATNLNTSPPTYLATSSVAVGDFNKDGNSDLVTANSGPNNVSLLLGNGDGTFGTATYFGVGSSPYTVAVGDFNGDGNSDLATANQTSNNVSILPGNGNGTFGAATNLSVGSSPYFVVVGDFNKDGKSDFATANAGSNSVSILLQNADGTFAPATNFTVANMPNYIALGDFDGDNNPDLATSNESGSNNVSILLGDGTGNFSVATNFGVGTQPLAIASGDFNADGKVDLATANNGSGNVSVLFGSGNGSFGTATNFVVGTNPQGIVVGDFNKDGLSDLATANFGGQNTSILLNTTPAVNFGAPTYSGTEGTADTVVNIPVTISGTPDAAVTVPIAINPSSTATENSDYTISPKTVIFPAGTTTLTQNVAFTIKPDNIVENAETAILNFGTITGGVAGTTKQTTLTIAANGQPSSLSPYQIDLKTGNITGQPNPFISLVNTPTDSNADSWLEAVAKINFGGKIKKAKFIVEYDKTPSGWTVNLGDSASNDGYGGDGGDQSRDSEMQIVNGNMAVFGNDYNTPPGGELIAGNVPNFVTNGSRVELEVSNEQLGWDNKSGLKNSLNSPYLYALNGQADDGPVNSEIYAGFNRVISENADRIGSGASKVTILLNPIDYAINAGTATVTEGNEGKTAATFTVTRSGCTELASTVDYAIAGTASKVTDYNNIGGTSGATGATGTINFAAGETSKTITLDVLGDSAIEANETLEVTLSNPSVLDSTPTLTTATATTTISNDDTAGVSITPTETTATEAGTNGTYSVVLKSQPSDPVTITLATGDQIEAIAPLTFTADNWDDPQTVTVKAVNDTIVEGAHSGNIAHTVTSADTKYNSGIVVPGVTVAITDNDVVPPQPPKPPVTSTLSPYQIDLKTGTITGQPNQFISLVNTPTDSNADSWLEAVAKINFDGNIKKAKFIVEYDKTPSGWTVNLGDSASNNGYGGDSITQSRDAEMNIVNDKMSVFGNDYNTPPGGELTPGNVPNLVTNGSRVELEVSNEQLGWDNKSGLKNSLNSPYLYALNGQPDATGPVNSEIYAGFNRVISGPGDRIGSGASKVTILLNPIDYAITAGVATVTEGNEGKTAATFTVTRSGCTELASTVDYAIAGTADSSDYNNIGGTSSATGATGTINFAAGETSKTITLDVLGDSAIEANETLEVTLSNPSVLDSTPTLTTASATTTITNDDTAGVTVNVASTSANEGGASGSYSVKLNNQPIAPVTITLTTGEQIEAIGPLTFTADNWSTAQTVTVKAVDDTVVEGAHSGNITHTVSSADTNYNGIAVPGVTVAIADNDTPPPVIEPKPPIDNNGTGTKPIDNNGTGTKPIDNNGTGTKPIDNNGTGTKPIDNNGTGTGGTNTFPIGIPSSNQPNNQILGIPTVSFSQATYQVNESRTGIVQKEITLTRTGNLSNFSKVDLPFPTGSATFGTDWNVPPFSPELTFNPGENTKTFTIDIFPDSQFEGTEEIAFQLTNRDNAIIGLQNTATLQIFDAEGPPTINFSPATYQVNESPTGIVQKQITLTRTGNIDSFSRVYLEPPTGSATFGTDWNTPNFSPELTFNPGENTKTFTIDVFPDGQFEGTEEIAFRIANGDNANIGTQNTASLKIIDAESTLNNRPPVVTNPLLNQRGPNFRGDFNLTLAPNTFTDPDPGDSLTYSYSIIPEPAPNGPFGPNPLDWLTFDPNTGTFIPPDWLTFDPNTLTFSVNLNAGNVPSFFYVPIKVTATDNAGASVSDFFHLYRANSLSGIAIDGYISGATVFLDANKNGIKDTNEPSTITDTGGKFNLDIPFEIFDTNKNGEIDPSEGNLVVTGGTDTATGLPLETPLTAPPDSTVVTLLTSLVADLIDKGIALEEAQSLVKAALGLPAEVDLTSLDPILATNNNEPGGVQVLSAMVKVQNFITQTSALIDGASSAVNTDIVKAVVSSITAQIQSGTVLNLSNAAALEPIIQQAAAKIQQIDPSFNTQQVSQITSQSATVMATANQRIDTAVSNPTATSIPESLARLQQVALGPTTQEFKEVGTGNKPISQLVADNTGTALDSRIEAVVLPAGIATPVVSGDADLGSNSPNAILGTNGDDILTGDSGNNVLMGMRGNDSLDGSLGNDSVLGGKGSDTLLGSGGDDALFGNRGADIVNGDDGNDMLYGGKGDDLLTGGLGIDSLIGGMGVDKFLLSTNSGTDTITDFEVGKDLLVLGNGLSFSQLAIAQDSGSTLIRLAQTGEILASLVGVSASSISAVNFGVI